jgi:hypothetical protein
MNAFISDRVATRTGGKYVNTCRPNRRKNEEATIPTWRYETKNSKHISDPRVNKPVMLSVILLALSLIKKSKAYEITIPSVRLCVPPNNF